MNRLLHELGYSLQANRKTLEGKQHPDRDAQFNYINRRVRAFQRQRQPVVSVDTKKKELVGPFKNGGREWRPHGHPEPVRVHEQDQAAGCGRGAPALDVLPHVPGDGDHRVLVERGDPRARPADRRPRLAEDDEALRPDVGHSDGRRAHRDLTRSGRWRRSGRCPRKGGHRQRDLGLADDGQRSVEGVAFHMPAGRRAAR